MAAALIKFLESDRASKCITPKRYGRKTQVTLETATLGGWLCGIGADSGFTALRSWSPTTFASFTQMARWCFFAPQFGLAEPK